MFAEILALRVSKAIGMQMWMQGPPHMGWGVVGFSMGIQQYLFGVATDAPT